jgi:hypothetical protein
MAACAHGRPALPRSSLEPAWQGRGGRGDGVVVDAALGLLHVAGSEAGPTFETLEQQRQHQLASKAAQPAARHCPNLLTAAGPPLSAPVSLLPIATPRGGAGQAEGGGEAGGGPGESRGSRTGADGSAVSEASTRRAADGSDDDDEAPAAAAAGGGAGPRLPRCSDGIKDSLTRLVTRRSAAAGDGIPAGRGPDAVTRLEVVHAPPPLARPAARPAAAATAAVGPRRLDHEPTPPPQPLPPASSSMPPPSRPANGGGDPGNLSPAGGQRAFIAFGPGSPELAAGRKPYRGPIAAAGRQASEGAAPQRRPPSPLKSDPSVAEQAAAAAAAAAAAGGTVVVKPVARRVTPAAAAAVSAPDRRAGSLTDRAPARVSGPGDAGGAFSRITDIAGRAVPAAPAVAEAAEAADALILRRQGGAARGGLGASPARAGLSGGAAAAVAAGGGAQGRSGTRYAV